MQWGTVEGRINDGVEVVRGTSEEKMIKGSILTHIIS